MIDANDPMLEVYLFENAQLLETLESILLEGEQNEYFSSEQIHELFRILHTIKGSSAMMGFDNMAHLSHILEDLFAYLRDHGAESADNQQVCALTFDYGDFIKEEMSHLQAGEPAQGDSEELVQRIESYYNILCGDVSAAPIQESATPVETAVSTVSDPIQTGEGNTDHQDKEYQALVFFEDDCKMENIRAFGILQSLESLCTQIQTTPADLMGRDSADEIVSNGFGLHMFSHEDPESLRIKIQKAFFVKSVDFKEVAAVKSTGNKKSDTKDATGTAHTGARQNFMSVNLNKLDKLMDIVGEIVITEATVTKNPDALKLQSESFTKAARQLGKLTDELQDIVMSIRMVSVATAFHNMRRIVRDISMKTGKKAELVLVGEETEADKNIVDSLADPLMHIVRNAMDHGLESESDRIRVGKNPVGRVTLEARNVGGDVLILISDDGRGLDRDALIKKGREKGLIKKPDEEITDSEAYSLIYTPGFSTKEEVTEFSGRGVGMDAAQQIIQKIGGSLSVESHPGQGTTVRIRIPLTLAIIRGLHVFMGGAYYILPLLSIRESFRPTKDDIIHDTDGNEMILIRGECYPILHLNKQLGIESGVTRPEDGILVMVQANALTYCLLVDELVGEEQTVVKPMPAYFNQTRKSIRHIAGCTLLGDGSISLVLDINSFSA